MAERTTTVLVVDDHPLFRDGLTGLLDTVEGMRVVGTASNGDEAVRRCRELAPDVVLMDLTMPGMSGLEATRRIVRDHPATAVLVLTMVDDDAAVTTALQVGARGYLLKGAVQEEVLTAVRTVADGGAVFGRGVAGHLLAGGRQRYDVTLSTRETEVLSLVAEGRSNAEIARELGISLKTVQNHVAHILQKMQVSDRTQAALRARGW